MFDFTEFESIEDAISAAQKLNANIFVHIDGEGFKVSPTGYFRPTLPREVPNASS